MGEVGTALTCPTGQSCVAGWTEVAAFRNGIVWVDERIALG